MKLNLEVLKSLIEQSSLDYKKKNVVGKCPYCGHNEFGISIENNHLFGCYRKGKCGETGNIFKLLKKLNRLDLIEHADNVTLPSTSHLEDIITQKKIELKQLPEIKPPLGWRQVYYHPYLEERGFTQDDYMNYSVGTTKLD